MENKNEAKGGGRQRVTIVKVVHPEKSIQAKFINAKAGEVADWIFEISKTLPKQEEPLPVLQWIPKGHIHGMKKGTHSTSKNSGHIYGLTVYIHNV